MKKLLTTIALIAGLLFGSVAIAAPASAADQFLPGEPGSTEAAPSPFLVDPGPFFGVEPTSTTAAPDPIFVDPGPFLPAAEAEATKPSREKAKKKSKKRRPGRSVR
jgi:hypothetical protein